MGSVSHLPGLVTSPITSKTHIEEPSIITPEPTVLTGCPATSPRCLPGTDLGLGGLLLFGVPSDSVIMFYKNM